MTFLDLYLATRGLQSSCNGCDALDILDEHGYCPACVKEQGRNDA
jgi:hypothetical protein